MTAPLPPALDYLIGQLETTAEKCQGGDGSNNALRKNGRGEGLRIAKSMIVKAWPAIQAQVDLPSAVEGERLRSALLELLDGGFECCDQWVDAGHEQDAYTDHDPGCPFASLAAHTQPSALWAGLCRLAEDLSKKTHRYRGIERRRFIELEEQVPCEDGSFAPRNAEQAALLASWDMYSILANEVEVADRRLRELLGLPPKEDR